MENIWNKCKKSSFIIHEVRGNEEIRNATTTCDSAGIILAGEKCIKTRTGIKLRIHQGCGFFIPKGCNISQKNTVGPEGVFKEFVLNISKSDYSDLNQPGKEMQTSPITPCPLVIGECSELCSKLIGAYSELEDKNKPNLVGDVLRSLQIENITLAPTDEPWSYKVRKAIYELPIESLSATEISSHLNTGESTLRKNLRSEGLNLRTMINDYKMEKAYGMLLEKRSLIKVVAISCGYASPASFTTNFKRKFGITPTDVYPDTWHVSWKKTNPKEVVFDF